MKHNWTLSELCALGDEELAEVPTRAIIDAFFLAEAIPPTSQNMRHGLEMGLEVMRLRAGMDAVVMTFEMQQWTSPVECQKFVRRAQGAAVRATIESMHEGDGVADQLDRVEAQRPRLRPAVAAMARLMEHKLRANDIDRGEEGWRSDTAEELFRRLCDEVDELCGALDRRYGVVAAERQQRTRAAIMEAVDVANFAMMIADVLGMQEIPEAREADGERPGA